MAIVRSKICGITRVEDAQLAAQAGADAIGLVFYAPSPRNVSVAQAADIIRALPAFVTSVGLFVNASAAEVNAVLAQVPLDLLQFHGDETPEFCQAFKRPYIKAVRVQSTLDILAACNTYTDAAGILLDTFVAGVPGGTGQAFDWSLIPQNAVKPLILAGGLDASNVAQAISQVKPYAVDVSGGVEASKGIKDPARVRAFVAAVRSM